MSYMSQLQCTNKSYCTRDASVALYFLCLGFCCAAPFYPSNANEPYDIEKSHPHFFIYEKELGLNSDPCCKQRVSPLKPLQSWRRDFEVILTETEQEKTKVRQ